MNRSRLQELVDIGFCNLHAVHNALRTGLAAVSSWCIDEFVQPGAVRILLIQELFVEDGRLHDSTKCHD
jgi:hypothetical protein